MKNQKSVKKYNFGDVVKTDNFPFDEDGFGKPRFCFILEDQGDCVAAAYLTTNPSGTVRLGVLEGGKVTNMLATKVAILHKDTLFPTVQRVEFAGCLLSISAAAHANYYGEASVRIIAEVRNQVIYARKRMEKKFAKK